MGKGFHIKGGNPLVKRSLGDPLEGSPFCVGSVPGGFPKRDIWQGRGKGEGGRKGEGEAEGLTRGK